MQPFFATLKELILAITSFGEYWRNENYLLININKSKKKRKLFEFWRESI